MQVKYQTKMIYQAIGSVKKPISNELKEINKAEILS